MSDFKTTEDVAIVGIGCRFPGEIHDTTSFWNRLLERVDVMQPIPSSRWKAEAVYDSNSTPGKTFIKTGGFIHDAFKFDPVFFNVTPREAAFMDPQARVVLHTAYEAIEDSGIPLETLRGTQTAVYMGVMNQDWGHLAYWDQKAITSLSGIGSDMSGLSNRVSFLLDLRGPSLTLGTLCSSSMNAVHLACGNLLRNECDFALAGGVNLMLTPDATIAYSNAGFLSKSSTQCKSFDSKADGYMRSEGCGIVLLKRLSDAIRDNDHIYSVIRASSSNHDGSKQGFTKPNGKAHQALLKEVLSKSSIHPHSVQYAEAHGTGTPVGDPIEVKAIGTVLGGKDRDTLLIGSVKSKSAAGAAALIKVALALKNKIIPANIHLENPNPNIPFEQLNVRVPTSAEPWPQNPRGGLRVAAINNFGAGGSNSGAIIEEYLPLAKQAIQITSPVLFPISAHSQTSLEKLAQHFLELFEDIKEGRSSVDFADAVYTASLRRSHLHYRLAMVASTPDQFSSLLKDFLANPKKPNNSSIILSTNSDGFPKSAMPKPSKASPTVLPNVAFVFCGMGPQWNAMGRQLANSEPVFLNTLRKVDGVLKNLGGVSLLEEILNSNDSSKNMEEAVYAQPGIFAIQVSLLELWKSWGVRPSMVVGHSFGEVAAAYASGAFTLEQATTIVYHRSRLLQKMRGTGSMLAASVSEARALKIQEESGGTIVVAALNGTNSVTFAGPKASLEGLEQKLKEEDLFAKMLAVNIPFHSPILSVIEKEYIESITDVIANVADIQTPMFSTVTGKRVESAQELNPYQNNNNNNNIILVIFFDNKY